VGCNTVEISPAEGGFSGETHISDSFGERVVVRIYGPRSAHRGPTAVDVDAAVLHLMRGIVPVPQVLEVRRPVADLPALLVTGFVEGVRGDVLLPALDDDAAATVGRNLGGILDRLAHIPTLRAGSFTAPDLAVEPFPEDLSDLPSYVESRRDELGSWSADELAGLEELAAPAQDLLDEAGRTCFVHSDLNLKNVLLDPETLAVTAVLDFEFAHSGSPYTDTGNLLRFDRRPSFVDAVLQAGGVAGLDQARAADLYALVDLAIRDHDPARRHEVTGRAHQLLRSIARTRDLHAWREA